jgi:hypothetical protein
LAAPALWRLAQAAGKQAEEDLPAATSHPQSVTSQGDYLLNLGWAAVGQSAVEAMKLIAEQAVQRPASLYQPSTRFGQLEAEAPSAE